MTKRANIDINFNIQSRLAYLKSLGDDYWSFKEAYKRDYSHSYFRYPAMMVPQMIRKILDELCSVDPTIKHVHDPFVGSGTILTESILRGLDFTGRDINPLSILLCKVKSGPLYEKALHSKINRLLKEISLDSKNNVEIKFKNIDKWFRKDIQLDLSRIKRSIKKENSLWARRFFWVVLAETVRQVSNSRSTTYKLHIRDEAQIATRKVDAIQIFTTLLLNNYSNLSTFRQHLKERNYLNKNSYLHQVNLTLGDAREKLNVSKKYDLVLTSPPYGDNHTTVTYGQYSYLPLQWIDLEDIDKQASATHLNTITAIDRMSLGGINYKEDKFKQELLRISPTYKGYVNAFHNKPERFIDKITAYFYDLNECLNPILDNLNENGYLIWTLGNRTVAGTVIRLDKVLIELFANKDIELIDIIYRPISNKRMASKNKSSKTILKESILIFRKGS